MNLFKRLGPGLLYAAAAIGVSHLIQSTRAGADFGYQLLWVVLGANLIKYPFFKAAPIYASKTGKTLIDAYAQMGVWVLGLVIALTIGTMFIIQAAVTIVTAGIANSILSINIHPAYTSLLLLIICFVILHFGKYNLLDNFVKYVVVILTVTTIATVGFATFSTFPKPDMEVAFDFGDNAHLFFLIALIGWMPAPMDIPIWHSLWVVERNKDQKSHLNFKETIFDFNVGFVGTAIVAALFVMLGALVMYRSGTNFSPKAAHFATQLIQLYTNALGNWSYPIIAIAAFTTMFSTTITCLDGSPRVMQACAQKLLPAENKKSYYSLFVVLIIIGTSILLFFFLSNMKQMVDFATTLSFIIAPVYAFLNYRLLLQLHREDIHPFQWWEKAISILGIIFLTFLTLYYLAVRY